MYFLLFLPIKLFKNLLLVIESLFITVPPVVVQVSTDPTNLGTLIEGTYIDLVCNSYVNDGVDTDYTVTVQWSRNGTTILNGTDYSISPVTTVSGNYISTLRIEELSTSDDYSLFTCSVIVTPSVSTLITGSDGNDDIIIKVRGLCIPAFE